MSLLERLPSVRGRLTENAPLAEKTWFRVGGPAEVLFKPADCEDLQDFLSKTPQEIPVTVIGVASNLLVRDGGVKGVVIRLGGAFAEVEAHGNTVATGAAALDLTVAQVAQQSALTGLEFLSGIPGSIGGALRMNAGCYGTEIADVVVTADAIDRTGKLHTLTRDDLDFAYRHCAAPKDWIFTAATLKAKPADPEAIGTRMAELQRKREESQPIRARTGGSTFANPSSTAKAWELIDKAGLRGHKIGGAQISEKHTNFLINTGTATAADIENLGEEARTRVKAHSGIDLRWEIARIGEK